MEFHRTYSRITRNTAKNASTSEVSDVFRKRFRNRRVFHGVVFFPIFRIFNNFLYHLQCPFLLFYVFSTIPGIINNFLHHSLYLFLFFFFFFSYPLCIQAIYRRVSLKRHFRRRRTFFIFSIFAIGQKYSSHNIIYRFKFSPLR